MFQLDSQLLHSPADDLPHWARANPSVRRILGQKNMTARTAFPAFLEVLNDRFANFILNRILLDSASLGAPHAEGLIAPIKIAQLKSGHLAASKPIDRK